MTTLRAAAAQALTAIENEESFDHFDNVIAPILRKALAENDRKSNKAGAEFGAHDMRGRILMKLRKGQMTTDELTKELRAARSTVNNAINELHRKKRICIVRWVRTGSSPMRYWGIGDQDAERPPLLTKEEISQRKKEMRIQQKKEQERMQALATNFTPRRDPAAAWF